MTVDCPFFLLGDLSFRLLLLFSASLRIRQANGVSLPQFHFAGADGKRLFDGKGARQRTGKDSKEECGGYVMSLRNAGTAHACKAPEQII